MGKIDSTSVKDPVVSHIKQPNFIVRKYRTNKKRFIFVTFILIAMLAVAGYFIVDKLTTDKVKEPEIDRRYSESELNELKKKAIEDPKSIPKAEPLDPLPPRQIDLHNNNFDGPPIQ